MAIETRRISLTQLNVGNKPVQTVTFSGAAFTEHHRLVPNAVRNRLGPRAEVLLVRFTTPSPNGKEGNSAEFPGEVGQKIAGALLRREGVQLKPGVEVLLSNLFSPKTDRKTGIGVTFADGEFTIPPATEVDIVTKVDIGL